MKNPTETSTSNNAPRIGFIQGRLSPKPEPRIQAFPKDTWREEFPRAREIGFNCIELIHDELYLEDNPLITDSGRRELVKLVKETGVQIGSICADYFMIYPVESKPEAARELLSIAKEVGCPLVEFPFVDSSSFKKRSDLKPLYGVLEDLSEAAWDMGLKIGLETDLPPVEFKELLSRFPRHVGANFDLGNSASLGWDALAECRAYGDRIVNVHIKDRVIGGTTVPLTTGHTDFERAFRGLKAAHYKGDYILQTCPDPDYLGVAAKYRRMVIDWLKAA